MYGNVLIEWWVIQGCVGGHLHEEASEKINHIRGHKNIIKKLSHLLALVNQTKYQQH